MNWLARTIRFSMSVKAALVVAIPVLVVTSLYSYYQHRINKQLLFRGVEMHLLHVSQGLERQAAALIAKKDVSGLNRLVSDVSQGVDAKLITLYDPQGKVTAASKNKWIGASMLDMYPEEITDNDIAAIKKGFAGTFSLYYDPDDVRYCFVMPIAYGNAGSRGAVLIDMDMKPFSSEIRKSVIRSSLGSFFATVVIGVFLYFLFHYFFIKRIQAVSGAAVRLAAGDMKVRASVEGTDEIGYLAVSFNVLAEEITNWRTNLEEMVTHRVKELSALYEVAYIISQSLELNKVLSMVLDHVLETFGEQKGVVALVGDEGDTLKLIGHRGFSADGIQQISRSRVGEGCAGDVILNKRTIRISSAEDEEFKKKMPGLEQEGIQSALAVPISTRGVALGAVVVYSEKEDRFTEQDEALLATIGNQVGVAVENARLYEKTLELALEDGLTGLANRRHFMETLMREVSRACRYGVPLSLLLLDLDRFKQFNDTCGHIKGDELLTAFASLIKGNIRATDIAGRYGGEEFVVILPNTPLKGAIVIAERIRRDMEGLKISVKNGVSAAGTTVSIGIAEFTKGESDEDFLEAADAALYRAKQGGRNRVAW